MQLKAGREFILQGDENIAHKQIDIKNWRSNQKSTAASCRKSAPG